MIDSFGSLSMEPLQQKASDNDQNRERKRADITDVPDVSLPVDDLCHALNEAVTNGDSLATHRLLIQLGELVDDVARGDTVHSMLVSDASRRSYDDERPWRHHDDHDDAYFDTSV
jgi:hypothetical protein